MRKHRAQKLPTAGADAPAVAFSVQPRAAPNHGPSAGLQAGD